MKAAVIDRYGPPEVVRIAEVETPRPGDDEVLVRVTTTTVNSGDSRVRALRVPGGMSILMRLALGFTRPRNNIGGFECAGVVEAVGRNVTKFKPGDRVVASRGFKFGCHAECVVVAESGSIARIPEDLGDAEAVTLLFGGTTALIFFERGGLKAGERVLINGASGAVGVMAVQLAKHFGADVTAICSGRNAELIRSLGADRVVDYAREDVTRSGGTWDVIMDTHGNLPYARVKHLLAPGGRFLMVIGNLPQMIASKWQKAVVNVEDNDSAVSAASYARLLDLGAKGVIRPVIDSTYPFDRIVEAHRRVDSGHKVGSVVVTVPA